MSTVNSQLLVGISNARLKVGIHVGLLTAPCTMRSSSLHERALSHVEPSSLPSVRYLLSSHGALLVQRGPVPCPEMPSWTSLMAGGLSKRRLAHQRRIKRQQSQHPIVEMSKGQVEDESLGKYVIMPDSEKSSFKTWWCSLPESTVVSVRLPCVTHGHAGKPSNSAKKAVLEDFLTFVDTNSEPNGRSDNPTHYFVSKFSTVQAPKPGCSQYQQRLKRSIVGEFNHTQREAGRGTCSNGSSYNWLKKY